MSGDNGGQTRRNEREEIFGSLIMYGGEYLPSSVEEESDGYYKERPYPREDIRPSGRSYSKNAVASKYHCDGSYKYLQSIQIC